MKSFKSVRELLLLSYVNNAVSDRKFVLLYDAYQFKTPDNMTRSILITLIQSINCKTEFRVEKADLTALSEASLVFDTPETAVNLFDLAFQLWNPTHLPG